MPLNPYTTSKPIRIISIAIFLSVVLLWITNAFLGGFDPRLLRQYTRLNSGSESGLLSGFEKVEKLSSEDAGTASGGDKVAGDGTKKGKLWFFGKWGEKNDEAAEGRKPSASPPSNKDLIYEWVDGARPAIVDSTIVPLQTATDEEWFRMHATASDVTAAAATGTEVKSGRLVGDQSKHSSTSTTEQNLSPTSAASPVSAPDAIPGHNLLPEHWEKASAGGMSHSPALISNVPSQTASPSTLPTTLVLYAFSASSWALPNLRFFLSHALHAHATFVFILNGALPELAQPPTTTFAVDPILVNATNMIQTIAQRHKNIKIINRPNTCYDLGAFGEVLLSNSSELYSCHSRFILLNASLRGPFVPMWSRECWSDAYLRTIDAGVRDWKGREIKMVGMTMNCVAGRERHVQSMILATDKSGMGILLGGGIETIEAANRKMTGVGLDSCPKTYNEAVDIEVSLTPLMLSQNFSVKPMMSLAHGTADYVESCTNGDVNAAVGAYEGGNLHPFETMWIKTRWGVGRDEVERLSGWLDGAVGLMEGVEWDEWVAGGGGGRAWDLC